MGRSRSRTPVKKRGKHKVLVSIGTYGDLNDGIAINLTYYFLTGDDHWDFMVFIKTVAGFRQPETVNFVKNKNANTKVDWNKLRIPPDECQLANVVASAAVNRLRKAFGDGEAEELFDKVTFEVAEHANG